MTIRRLAYRTVLASFLATLAFAAPAQITMRDDLLRPIVVKEPATRIVTLAPFLTELVYAVGAGDRLVGVSQFSDYPPEARKLPQVATGAGFTLERIASLNPDLVLAWKDGIRREDAERISGFGAIVYVASARTLEDVPRLLEVIGLLTGTDGVRPKVDFQEKLTALRKKNEAKPRLTVFMEIWNRPLTTISGTHYMNQALEICHGDNVFKELTRVAPTVEWEDLYSRNPSVIVGAASAQDEKEFRSNWEIRPGLEAVKENRLVYIANDALLRPSTRVLTGIDELCTGLDKFRPKPAPPPSPFGM
jgi:iron complex transport system substrate-binding protein